MKLRINLLLVLFNLLVLSGYGQVKLVTVLDTVKVESIVVSRVSDKVKKAINNHLKHLKEESYCISNKSHIMIIHIDAFDTVNPDKYIDLIDYTEKDNRNEKYVIDVYIARKIGEIIYQLNDVSGYYFYFKYKGWDVYLYTKLDFKFRTKKKIKRDIFPLKYRKYTSDKEGTLPYEYINYILDVRDYENDATIYKLDKSDIEK